MSSGEIEGLVLLQVDAFSAVPFAGNPAAVCFLDRPRDDAWLLSVSAEMNLAETAFLLSRPDGYDLRWFTPTTEVPLCGHATLASAHAVWHEKGSSEPLAFHSASGVLSAEREGDWIRLDFPLQPSQAAPIPPDVAAAMGASVVPVNHEVAGSHHLIEVANAAAVRAAQPDLAALSALGKVAVILCARADDDESDFVSRFFAPGFGIDEDPVTGAAHCTLASYWGVRLGLDEMTGYQASPRGGTVRVRLVGDRVHLLGQAVTILRGTLRV